MPDKVRFLFRKGAIDVILYLNQVDKAGYYEIYKQGFVVSRQTFSNLLKTLERRSVISREVIESRPPRVDYRLTEKGKKVAKCLDEMKRIL